MIYHQPMFRTLGDTALNIEFGDETSIALNFRILALDISLRAQPPNCMVETNPQVRTLGIVYKPMVTTRDKMIAAWQELMASAAVVAKLPSRKMTIPALYDDPWSRDCAEAFGVRNNMEYIAEFNNMTPEQVIAAHTACDYWVTGVGFVPGAFMSYAMDPRQRIGAPLYRTPRSWTPARLLNFGGATSTIYPIRVPGGGQLFGRTPINIFEAQQKNAIFADGPVLARAGDRHRYRAISRDEYDHIRELVEAGNYEYQIEEDNFDCAQYIAWLESLGAAAEKTDPDSSWSLA